MSEPLSKKRTSERQLSKDDEEEDESTPIEDSSRGFAKADPEVIASRRIVKARRRGASGILPEASGSVPATSNPFAALAIPLSIGQHTPNPENPETPPPAGIATSDAAPANARVAEASESETTAEEVTSAARPPHEESKPDLNLEVQATLGGVESTAEKPTAGPTTQATEGEGIKHSEDSCEGEGETEAAEEVPVNPPGPNPPPSDSFAYLSSAKNAFSGSLFGGTGFSSNSFSFGSTPQATSGFSFTPAPSGGFGSVGSTSSFPSLTSVFGAPGVNGSQVGSVSGQAIGGGELRPGSSPLSSSTVVTLSEVPISTGEEGEECVFSGEASLYEFVEGGKWKERGKGEVKLNISKGFEKRARLVMRAKGNLRLLLNAGLFGDMKLARMDGRGVSFSCFNSAGGEEGAGEKAGLGTYAVRLKDAELASQFLETVEANKEKGSKEEGEGKPSRKEDGAGQKEDLP